MTVLSEKELIQIRRHLHEIPELALQEKETHDYLLKVIKNLKQDHLTIVVPKTLPTAILGLVKGINPKKTIGYRTDITCTRTDWLTFYFKTFWNNACLRT